MYIYSTIYIYNTICRVLCCTYIYVYADINTWFHVYIYIYTICRIIFTSYIYTHYNTSSCFLFSHTLTYTACGTYAYLICMSVGVDMCRLYVYIYIHTLYIYTYYCTIALMDMLSTSEEFQDGFVSQSVHFIL